MYDEKVYLMAREKALSAAQDAADRMDEGLTDLAVAEAQISLAWSAVAEQYGPRGVGSYRSVRVEGPVVTRAFQEPEK